MDPEELAPRRDAAAEQINAIFDLNARFQTNFTYLSEAIGYGRVRGLFRDAGEVERYDRVNQAANDAKHKGLGVDVDGGGADVAVVPRSQLPQRDDLPHCGGGSSSSSPIFPSQLGDCISQLQCEYSSYIGRPLRKNEPSYRGLGSRGPFRARVYLGVAELAEKVELVGDEYTNKQDAKHSAALQALNYLGTKPALVGERPASDGPTQLSAGEQLARRMEALSLSGGHDAAGMGCMSQAPIFAESCSAADTATRTPMCSAIPDGSTMPEDSPLPSLEQVLAVLANGAGSTATAATAVTALKSREVYLLAMGRDPKKTTIGSDNKKRMKKQLMQWVRQGKLRNVGPDEYAL